MDKQGKVISCKNCDWAGDISKAQRLSDKGFVDGVWWWVSWFCPECRRKIAEVNNNTPEGNELLKSIESGRTSPKP